MTCFRPSHKGPFVQRPKMGELTGWALAVVAQRVIFGVRD
jgi:hypothetical protein